MNDWSDTSGPVRAVPPPASGEDEEAWRQRVERQAAETAAKTNLIYDWLVDRGELDPVEEVPPQLRAACDYGSGLARVTVRGQEVTAVVSFPGDPAAAWASINRALAEAADDPEAGERPVLPPRILFSDKLAENLPLITRHDPDGRMVLIFNRNASHAERKDALAKAMSGGRHGTRRERAAVPVFAFLGLRRALAAIRRGLAAAGAHKAAVAVIAVVTATAAVAGGAAIVLPLLSPHPVRVRDDDNAARPAAATSPAGTRATIPRDPGHHGGRGQVSDGDRLPATPAGPGAILTAPLRHGTLPATRVTGQLVPGPGPGHVVLPLTRVVGQVIPPGVPGLVRHVTRPVRHLVRPVTRVIRHVVHPVTRVVRHVVRPVTRIVRHAVRPVTRVVRHLVRPVGRLVRHLTGPLPPAVRKLTRQVTGSLPPPLRKITRHVRHLIPPLPSPLGVIPSPSPSLPVPPLPSLPPLP